MRNQKFNEASLSRMYQDFKNSEWSIITSWRSGDEKNKSNLEQMKREVKSKGFGYVRLDGMGQEEIDGKVVSVKEPSLFIKNSKEGGKQLMDSDSFKNFIFKLGKDYNQWGAVYSNPKVGTQLIAFKDSDGNLLDSPSVEMTFKNFHPKKTSEFFSKLKGQPFYFSESSITEKIKKVDGKWAVYPSKGGDRLGTHSNKKDALKQLAAIEISKNKRKVKESFYRILEGESTSDKINILKEFLGSFK